MPDAQQPHSPTVVSDLASLPERIRTSRDRMADLRKQLANEQETRNELIVQAVDHAGIKLREVAADAGVSVPQVIRVLATSSED